jgi:phenylacetate-CoA ligase
MPRRVAYLAQLLRNETLPFETLAARQARTLCELVRYAAARVPFYRDLYAAHGVDAAAFDGLDDLQRLPIVDKHLLREAGAAALSIDAPRERVMISTSGSSGEPFRFPIDRRYDLWRKAQFHRPYLSSGRRLRDRTLRLTSRPTALRPWFSRLGLLREWQFDCATDPARLVEAWQELAPDVLQAYPSSLRSLAHHCLDRGEPLHPAPRLVFADSELLTADTRNLLTQAFGTPPIDIFGTYETDNIAWQCRLRDGYHIATDCVVLEIVRDGKPVPLGEEGEIVVTVLHNRTFPFIRYNLRDIGRFSTRPCACGLPFPLLAGIHGRANDLIVLADGRRRTALDIVGRIGRATDAIRHYQLRQLDVGRFELLIVPSRRFADAEKESIVSVFRSALEHAEVELRLVDVIPQDRSGKRRAFVSELGPRA